MKCQRRCLRRLRKCARSTPDFAVRKAWHPAPAHLHSVHVAGQVDSIAIQAQVVDGRACVMASLGMHGGLAQERRLADRENPQAIVSIASDDEE